MVDSMSAPGKEALRFLSFDPDFINSQNREVRAVDGGWIIDGEDEAGAWPDEYVIVGLDVHDDGDFWCIDASDPVENLYHYSHERGLIEFAGDSIEDTLRKMHET